jgi:SAM-dependent methyltransferase
MNPYRRRVLESFDTVLRPHAPVASCLDFGAGDGWFASSFVERNLAKDVTAVDVQARGRTFTPVTLYDGVRLPFGDRSFELVSSVDVLHHCPDPRASLQDALRCSSRFFLLKDHTYSGPAGRAALAILDEIGNRRFGIPSPFNYRTLPEWSEWIDACGFARRHLVHPAPCHTGALGWATNSLQFIGLWERRSA